MLFAIRFHPFECSKRLRFVVILLMKECDFLLSAAAIQYVHDCLNYPLKARTIRGAEYCFKMMLSA